MSATEVERGDLLPKRVTGMASTNREAVQRAGVLARQATAREHEASASSSARAYVAWVERRQAMTQRSS
jgi:hypothetical protein